MTTRVLQSEAWRMLAILSLALLLPSSRVRTQAPLRLADTAAARAFMEERFVEAAVEFEKLESSNPGNVVVLRYLALSYDRQGRTDDALATFRRALALAPDNVALLYHAGTACYNARLADEAGVYLRRAIDLDPDGPYAGAARDYLNAMVQQVKDRQSAGAPARIGVFLQLGLEREDYWYKAADGEPDERRRTDRFTEYLSVDLYLVRQPDWVVSLELNGYGTQALDEKDDRQDLWQTGTGLLLQHSSKVGSVPVIGTIKGFQQRVTYDGGPDYSDSFGGLASVQFGFTDRSTTRFHYRYTGDRFEYDGFDPYWASRDADNHGGGIRHTLYSQDRNTWLTLGADYQDNRADGRNFIFDGPAYSASLSLPLFRGVRLDTGYEYATENYPDFEGPGDRDTTRHAWNASLSRWLGRNVLVRLSYSDLDEESSVSSLSYDRRLYGVSVAYVY